MAKCAVSNDTKNTVGQPDGETRADFQIEQRLLSRLVIGISCTYVALVN